jgi:hypothetical protein
MEGLYSTWKICTLKLARYLDPKGVSQNFTVA